MSEDRNSIAAPPPHARLVIAAWIMTFLMPLIGFILGIILAAKNRIGQGVGTMVVSVIWALVVVIVSVNAYNAANKAVGENLQKTFEGIARELKQPNR